MSAAVHISKNSGTYIYCYSCDLRILDGSGLDRILENETTGLEVPNLVRNLGSCLQATETVSEHRTM